MKKLILSIGSISATIFPLAVVLACGNSSKKTVKKEKNSSIIIVENDSDNTNESIDASDNNISSSIDASDNNITESIATEDKNIKKEPVETENISFAIAPFLQNKGLKDLNNEELKSILSLVKMGFSNLPFEDDEIVKMFNYLVKDGGIKGLLEDSTFKPKFTKLITNGIFKKANPIESFTKQENSEIYNLKIKENTILYLNLENELSRYLDSPIIRTFWEELENVSSLSEDEINILKSTLNVSIKEENGLFKIKLSQKKVDDFVLELPEGETQVTLTLNTLKDFDNKKSHISTFFTKLLYEGLGKNKEEAKANISSLLDTGVVGVSMEEKLYEFGSNDSSWLENLASLIIDITITMENVIDGVLASVYESQEDWYTILTSWISESNFNFEGLEPIFKKGILNFSQGDFNKVIRFLKNFKNFNLTASSIYDVKLFDRLPEGAKNFIDNFDKINEDTLSSINKFINNSLSNLKEVKEYQELLNLAQTLLTFFVSEDNTILQIMKVLEKHAYIIKDIIDNGFQSTENVTESEKIYLIEKLAGDVEILGQSIKDYLPLLLGFDPIKTQQEDIKKMKNFLESNELTEKELYTKLSSSMTKLENKDIEAFINLRNTVKNNGIKLEETKSEEKLSLEEETKKDLH